VADEEFPTTTYAVLGMLAFGVELSGYELRRWALNLRFFYWSPAQSQIYAELRRLLAAGYVSERTEPIPNRPEKRLYRITDAGLAEFRRWMDESRVEPPLLRHSVALRVFFGHQTSPRRLREILTEYATQLKAQLDELTKLKAGLGETFDYPALVAGWGQRYYRAELAAIRELLHRLDTHTAAERTDE
jgi:DNA-binding PadR family transcriptional regulator